MSTKITVFTPTYNRAYIIEKLYRSLQRQTLHDFEWLIVDDGSSDNTEALIEVWMREDNSFPIRYYKIQNGGKCRAINYGLDKAEGELFFPVDSDDYLTDDAIEKIIYWENTITDKSKFAGVVGNRGNSPVETPNKPLGAPYRDSNAFERYPEYTGNVLDGERAGAWYTDIHRKYKYPEYDGENFMTLSVAWNRMAHDGYKVRVFQDIIWVCKYLPDGLTLQGNQKFIKNPKGAGLWLKEMADFLGYSFKKRCTMWYTFYCDHTFCDEKYNLTKKQCAEYIGAPVWFMYFSAMVHKISQFMKRRKK